MVHQNNETIIDHLKTAMDISPPYPLQLILGAVIFLVIHGLYREHVMIPHQTRQYRVNSAIQPRGQVSRVTGARYYYKEEKENLPKENGNNPDIQETGNVRKKNQPPN